MPEDDIDLLAINRGTIAAPAGCGKTHLIAETLKRHTGTKPILVLTHTNAGVAALRGRLDRADVPRSSYRLATIDGWSIRIVSTFPGRAGLDPTILDLTNPRADYPNIRKAARRVLEPGHVNDILAASYARLLVDECQDCVIDQFALIFFASQCLPACVLGDPMQAIFGFGRDSLADWDEHICNCFPLAGELDTPWRWRNAGAEELGQWLLDVRTHLIAGQPIDLQATPDAVTWVELDGDASDHEKLVTAARTRPPGGDGRVLVIGDSISADSRYRIAKSVHGAVTVEAVDLKDLVSFARRLDLDDGDALETVAEFAQKLMTNVGAADLVRRVQSLQRGTARKEATDVEQVAIEFVERPSYRAALDLLVEINKSGGVRVYRPAVQQACHRALRACDADPDLPFYEATVRMREENRLRGRPLPKRAIGSTLLLKGLEAEASIILNAAELDSRNLYVAMTRGSKLLTVCSPTPILTP